MRDIEEKILKSLNDDIKILKRANTKINDIIEYINIYKVLSNYNSEEYKEKLNKLMEGLK